MKPSEITEDQRKAAAERLGRSLAEALEALYAHRKAVVLAGRRVPRLLCADDLDFSAEGMRQDEAEAMKNDPMEHVLIHEIQLIGWEAYAYGGIPMMHRVARVMYEAIAPDLLADATDTMDKRWDGIGIEAGKWCC